MSAGGNASWTKGENFALLLAHSPYAYTVARLYQEAGLNLFADLATLTAGANIPADPAAIASLQQTSVPTGRCRCPSSTSHDPRPARAGRDGEQYADVVRAAGNGSLLRQAYVDRYGHCAFSASEIVAGVEAINHRVATGRWDSVAEPQKLEDFANSLGLDAAAFVQFQPLRSPATTARSTRSRTDENERRRRLATRTGLQIDMWADTTANCEPKPLLVRVHEVEVEPSSARPVRLGGINDYV